MAYTPKQWRAIKLYSETNNVVPQLSAFPNIRFMDKQGEITTLGITNLELLYEGFKEREKREKAQERREVAKREKAEKNAALRGSK